MLRHLVFALLLTNVAFAEVDPLIVAHRCGAAPILTGAEYERVRNIATQLLFFGLDNLEIALIDSDIINAWALPVDRHRSLICIPAGLARWEEDSDGQLAFIIGHEIGHTTDLSCKTIRGRAHLAARSHSLFSLVFGASNGDESGDQRNCELRADAIGIQLLIGAGYDPQDAVLGFERLKQLTRDRRSGILGRLRALGDDHPITADRIKHLRKLLAHRWQSAPPSHFRPTLK